MTLRQTWIRIQTFSSIVPKQCPLSWQVSLICILEASTQLHDKHEYSYLQVYSYDCTCKFWGSRSDASNCFCWRIGWQVDEVHGAIWTLDTGQLTMWSQFVAIFPCVVICACVFSKVVFERESTFLTSGHCALAGFAFFFMMSQVYQRSCSWKSVTPYMLTPFMVLFLYQIFLDQNHVAIQGIAQKICCL